MEIIEGVILALCIIITIGIAQHSKLAAVMVGVAFFIVFKPTQPQEQPARSAQVIATSAPEPLIVQVAPEATTVSVQVETEGIRPQPTTIAVQVQAIEPQPQVVQVVSRPQASSASSCCLWPVPSSWRVTQQPRTGHTALDIGAATGKPVLAAADGRVITRGWSNVGYGNHIILDHGNGLHTLYAHFSGYVANHGQQVKRGEVIGLIGSTGKSTGPHLHFEVRRNGALQNPWNYLTQ